MTFMALKHSDEIKPMNKQLHTSTLFSCSTILWARFVSVGRTGIEIYRHITETDRRAQFPRGEQDPSGAPRDEQQPGKIPARGIANPW
jgi:hypothetical protein